MITEADRRHMRHALGLGARGLGRTWPNPAVGCVIVEGERIVGRGWTQPGGRPHAEVMALQQAGAAARGATAYVTLEPCAHHGRTPPCTGALIGAGIARVVSAISDPDPRVAGRGHEALRAAGIAVTEGVEADAARVSHAGFLRRVTEGLPLVTLKLATTLDGRIATASGESRWITGDAARRQVHLLRLTHDAVLVGAGTARSDDPDLTVRDMGADHQPVRVVIDIAASLPVTGRLGRTATEVPVWICHGNAASSASLDRWRHAGARLFPCAETEGRVDLRSALQALAGAGLTRVLCEGGGQLAASLLRAGLVDRMVAFAAGRVIGDEGRASVGAMGIGRLAEAKGFALKSVTALGEDVMSEWQKADMFD